METGIGSGKKSKPQSEFSEGVLLKGLLSLFNGRVEDFGKLAGMSRSKIYSLYKEDILPEPERSLIFNAINKGNFYDEKEILAHVLFPEHYNDRSKKNADNIDSVVQNKSFIKDSTVGVKSGLSLPENIYEEIKHLREKEKELIRQNGKLMDIIQNLTNLMNKSENK